MIEIKKKRALFHQRIRSTQRESFKAEARKRLSLSQKRQHVVNALDEAFEFIHQCETGKKNTWWDQFKSCRDIPRRVYDRIESICQRTKLIMCEYERDSDLKNEIREYLINKVPLLIPPANIDLLQFPSSFIELCLYILRQNTLSSQEKQSFIQSLHNQTVNRCLLNYFLDNWTEIRLNQCNDITMMFFYEMNMFKNIFKSYLYNDAKFQFLLNLVIKEILQSTQAQRMVYQKFELDKDQFIDNLMSNQSVFEILRNKDFCNGHSQRIEKHRNVLNKSIFLCNLLLLSPIPNYNIKQTKEKLKAILNYLHRAFLIKQESHIPKCEVQFCISLLLTKTLDHNSYDSFHIVENVLKSGLCRASQQKQIAFEECQQNQEIIIDIQRNPQNKSSMYQNADSRENIFQVFLNKIKLLMIHKASQKSQMFKFTNIQKWLIQQIRNEKNNIFSLQNPDIMCCLFNLLSTILLNESKHKYNSYRYDRTRILNPSQQCLITKIKICKLIGKKGFDQLFQHQNLKNYCQELSSFFYVLLDSLQKCGNISSSISVLFFNSDVLQSNQESFKFSDQRYVEVLGMEEQQSLNVNFFKLHIYTLCTKFLGKSYKFLKYQQKQKLILKLILVDYLTFEECRKYLTQQEEYRLKKNACFNEEDYELNDYSIEQENNQSSQEQNQITKDHKNTFYEEVEIFDQLYLQNDFQHSQNQARKYHYQKSHNFSNFQSQFFQQKLPNRFFEYAQTEI